MSKKNICNGEDCSQSLPESTEFHCEICGGNFCYDCFFTEDSHICDWSECPFKENCNDMEICGNCCEKKLDEVGI